MRMSNLAKTIVIGFALLCAVPQEGHAQKQYAAFIHGFYFGDDREVELKDKGRYMKTSGTPDQWENVRAIDDKIFLRYYDRDLYGTGSTEDNTRRDMMQRFVEEMKEKGANAEWILVGHSQGGIVARLLHEYIRKNEPGLNVEGVLAIASPMQGAKPAAVSYGQRSGYKNIGPVVDGFIDNLTSPVDTEFFPISNLFPLFASKELEEHINSLAADKNAKQAIGPDGDLIQKINRARNPDAYRALLGAERAPVPFRILSGSPIGGRVNQLFGNRWESFFVTDLTDSFVKWLDVKKTGDVRPGDESETVKLHNRILSKIKTKEDKAENETTCRGWWILENCSTDYNKRQWRTTRRTFENIGRTHTEVLDAYRVDRKTLRYKRCAPAPVDEPTRYRSFSPPSAREHVNATHGSERNCWWETETYYVTVPNKTDGLLGTNTTTWNPPEKGRGPNLGPHSKLYSDDLRARNDGNPHTKGGTGYHHAEMMYAKRRYSSSADPGIADDEFDEGDPNPPIQEGEDFLNNKVFP